MKSKKIFFCYFLIFTFIGPSVLFAGIDNHAIKIIPTMTRLVKIFSDEEIALQQSLAKGDIKQINALLDKDFEERKASNPNSPVPLNQWVKSKLKQENKVVNQEYAVHQFGDIYVVSFLAVQENNKIFVVDIWKEKDSRNILMVRYRYE